MTWNFPLMWADDEDGVSRVAGASIFTFQKVKRGHSMAQTGESLYVLYMTYKHTCIVLNCLTRFQDIDTSRCLRTSVLLSLASELARTPAKSVTFSTDTEPSTPTRTGRSKLSQHFSFFCCCCNSNPFTHQLNFVSLPSLLEQRGVNRTPQRVSFQRLSFLHHMFSFILFYLNLALVYYLLR